MTALKRGSERKLSKPGSTPSQTSHASDFRPQTSSSASDFSFSSRKA
jgi:hypothetical protein